MMKTRNALYLAGAIVLLSQLSLTAQYSSGAEGEEENVYQNEQGYEQPFDNEQELMSNEEGLFEDAPYEMEEQSGEPEGEFMPDEEAGLMEEMPPELEEQFVEPEGDFMIDEEAGQMDDYPQEELEQDMPQQWDAPAAE